MPKPSLVIKDRRQDHALRLKVAVRRAHDPIFAPLRPADKAPPPPPASVKP